MTKLSLICVFLVEANREEIATFLKGWSSFPIDGKKKKKKNKELNYNSKNQHRGATQSTQDVYMIPLIQRERTHLKNQNKNTQT